MRAMLPQRSHKGASPSRLTRKRGVFYWRRRLPNGREVAISLTTRGYREAEHRAGLVNGAFDGAWRKAMAESGSEKAGPGAKLLEPTSATE